MPGSKFRPFETKTQSYRGPGISPKFQNGAARIVSQYIPMATGGSNGAQKMARAEWNTLMCSAWEIIVGGMSGGGAMLMGSEVVLGAICCERYCPTRSGRFRQPMCCPRP